MKQLEDYTKNILDIHQRYLVKSKFWCTSKLPKLPLKSLDLGFDPSVHFQQNPYFYLLSVNIYIFLLFFNNNFQWSSNVSVDLNILMEQHLSCCSRNCGKMIFTMGQPWYWERNIMHIAKIINFVWQYFSYFFLWFELVNRSASKQNKY